MLLLLGVFDLLAASFVPATSLLVDGLVFPIVDEVYFGSSLSFTPLIDGVGFVIVFATPDDNLDLIDCCNKF